MEKYFIFSVAFVVIDVMAGSMAGRLVWHYNHRKEIEESNPQYSYMANWILSATAFIGLMWVSGQIKSLAPIAEITKLLAACLMVSSVYVTGWRPKFVWRQ